MPTYNSISPVKKKYPPAKPTVTSGVSSAITGSTATCAGNVTSEGTAAVTERGICYGTSSNPTTSGSKVVSGSGTGAFTANITGLSENTTYYFRAYAKNSVGTSYGSNKSFATVSSSLAVVTTGSINTITNTSAVGAGSVTNIGGSAVTAKGLCYSLTPNPTTSSNVVSGGTGIGAFTGNLTGLTINTNYYVRAFATNSAGTAYGSEVTFKTTNVVATPFSLYIDGFDAILGDSGAETTLKNFLVEKVITQPIFYMGSLLDSSPNRTAMRAFCTELNTAGIVKRSANVTQATAVNTGDAGSKASYNNGCATDAEKFTNFRSEIEFYKSNPYVNSFAEFQTEADAIKTWCDSNNVTYDCYYARAEDVAGIATPEEIADYLVATFDVLCLVNYILPTKFATYGGFSPSIKAQFQLIADAANRASKVQKMDMIFASQGNIVGGVPTNMRTYFVANPTLIPAYNAAKSTYNGLSLTNKNSLNFLGQTIYALEGVADL
jgi:hypothetical protein